MTALLLIPQISTIPICPRQLQLLQLAKRQLHVLGLATQGSHLIIQVQGNINCPYDYNKRQATSECQPFRTPIALQYVACNVRNGTAYQLDMVTHIIQKKKETSCANKWPRACRYAVKVWWVDGNLESSQYLVVGSSMFCWQGMLNGRFEQQYLISQIFSTLFKYKYFTFMQTLLLIINCKTLSR